MVHGITVFCVVENKKRKKTPKINLFAFDSCHEKKPQNEKKRNNTENWQMKNYKITANMLFVVYHAHTETH